MCLSDPNTALLIGGETADQSYGKDSLWKLELALPVSDNRILVSGGCSAIGALQDVHIFNTDTSTWSSVASPALCSKPRAGHSMISLGCSIPTDGEKRERGESVKVHCALLVFGGSDCSGTFYNDTVRCTVEVPVGK
ncbi:acyl-CoA-binding domain-containing protein 4-like isoform X1 [Solea senegalensis]|uniref:Acyl-CoA-binding domain-containing protein 4-like isoform X1 n=1 Tax=Solea senegalensis TaxID=28829 RepID=A0AAV6S2V6_SOLSE|nr:acyl-CoA-binding domain-containing protein 4-like isoform X1 [Solea senegalensis]